MEFFKKDVLENIKYISYSICFRTIHDVAITTRSVPAQNSLLQRINGRNFIMFITFFFIESYVEKKLSDAMMTNFPVSFECLSVSYSGRVTEKVFKLVLG